MLQLLADIRNEDMETIGDAAYANAARLFHIRATCTEVAVSDANSKVLSGVKWVNSTVSKAANLVAG